MKGIDQSKGSESSAKRYLMCITPRSGSTYLSDLLSASGKLGLPREYFNPEFRLRSILDNHGLDTYLKGIVDDYSTPNGVFGAKVGFFHFQPLSGQLKERFDAYIMLTRQDIVLQAVSLYVATGIHRFHSIEPFTEESQQAFSLLRYDGDQILSWGKNILYQELGWWEFFVENHILPLHLEYEEIIERPTQTVTAIATYLNIPEAVDKSLLVSSNEKLGDDRNLEWAERFRTEYGDVIHDWIEERPCWPRWGDTTLLVAAYSAMYASESRVSIDAMNRVAEEVFNFGYFSKRAHFIKERDKIIKEKDEVITKLNSYLAAIQQSISWKVLERLRRVLDLLMPEHSPQRAIYWALRRFIRALVQKGWEVLSIVARRHQRDVSS